MKKFTQVMLLVLFAVSVAFAQQTKDFSAEKSTKKVTPSPTESVLVPSIMESFEGTFPLPAGPSTAPMAVPVGNR